MENIALDLPSLSWHEQYKVLSHLIIPRPIALVTTRSANNTVNAAPISFFNAVSFVPPVLSLSLGRKSDGGCLDTYYNLKESKACVVHIVDMPNADLIEICSSELNYGESELAGHEDKLIDSDLVNVPRIKGLPVQFECKLHSMTALGNPECFLTLLEILKMHIKPSVLLENNRIDIRSLNTIGRVGSPDLYVPVEDIFNLKNTLLA